MTEQIMFWATVLSPIVGVIAIIVAMIIAHSSSKDVQSQIKAIHKQIDIFVASQNPFIIESKRQYEQQLQQLDSQIREAELDVQTVHNPFYGMGPRIDDIEADEADAYRRQKLSDLLKERKNLEKHLTMLQNYINKTGN